MIETTVKVKESYSAKYHSGYPLLTQDALVNPQALTEEGQRLNIVDENGAYIGKGYYGRQNKGMGWILTQQQGEQIDEAFFERKLIKAIGCRKTFFEAFDTTAFRIFNGEGDGIGGFTIDYFAGFYLINWYSEGIYRFKAEVVNALTKNAGYRGVYEKKRFADGGKYVEDDDFICGERGEFPLIVQENGASFAVYLNEGAMTGVFLDQRSVRKAIRDRYADGRTVLNTFSYTGAFSVFASLGGALHTTSVDVANRSLPKTIEQFSLNGIDYEAQDIIVDDVFKFFKKAEKQEKRYGLVVLDPPSFARSKKMIFSAAKDYKDLLKQAISFTEDNGIIVASMNHAGVSRKKFRAFVDKAFQETRGKYKIIESHSLPEDYRVHPNYPEGNYLKVLVIKKLA